LIAGVAGEAAGGVDQHMERVAETLSHAARVSNGRVVALREREAVALFATPDAAARAALRLHAYALALPPFPPRLGVRICLHSGPMAQRGEEASGDTLDSALALLEAAAPGETLISEHAALALSPGFRRFVGPFESGGKGAGRLRLGELVLRKEAGALAQRMPRVQLRLAYRSQSIVRRREGDAAVIGSDAACDLAVDNHGVSLRHCTIFRRLDACVLRDHSANGTFVTLEDGAPVAVRGDEIALSGRGFISFGRANASGDDVVRYSCEG
jgi:hypothetical protein